MRLIPEIEPLVTYLIRGIIERVYLLLVSQYNSSLLHKTVRYIVRFSISNS